MALKKGWNTVVMAISRGDGGTGFSMKIRNSEGGTPEGINCQDQPPIM